MLPIFTLTENNYLVVFSNSKTFLTIITYNYKSSQFFTRDGNDWETTHSKQLISTSRCKRYLVFLMIININKNTNEYDRSTLTRFSMSNKVVSRVIKRFLQLSIFKKLILGLRVNRRKFQRTKYQYIRCLYGNS